MLFIVFITKGISVVNGKATHDGVLVLTCGTLLSSQGTNAHE